MLITCVTISPRHIRVFWVLERLPRLFYKPSIWDNKLVAFARVVVEGMLPPTLHIYKSWWTLIYRAVDSEQEA